MDLHFPVLKIDAIVIIMYRCDVIILFLILQYKQVSKITMEIGAQTIIPVQE